MISIIVTYYNTGWMIGRCLESISVQTYDDYEVIIVDNGSTDKSKDAVDDVISTGRIKNCYYHRIAHTDINEAINYGIEQANGKYLMIMDGYDFLNINALHYYYWGLINSGADMIIGDFTDVFYKTRIQDINLTPDNYNVMLIKPDKMIQKMHVPTVHSDMRFNRIWNKVYKASLFNGLKLRKGKGGEITAIKDIIMKCASIAIASFTLYYKATIPNTKLDMTIADAYRERLDFLNKNCGVYGEKAVEGAQYLLLTNLTDIYLSDRSPEFRIKCGRELAEAYKLYFYCVPNGKRADLITRICKKLLTK